ncbi:MAG TPA: cytochrome c [Terriglobia bacterium]|nr:cytochrome c [Terriglobia bacterium]
MRSRIVQFAFVSLMVGTALYAKSGADRPATNPFENSQSARAAGQKLFMRHCAECHGEAAEGTDRAPSLRQFVRAAAPRTLHSFIKNGNLRAGMPSWSRLPDQQLWQLVTYLRTLEP